MIVGVVRLMVMMRHATVLCRRAAKVVMVLMVMVRAHEAGLLVLVMVVVACGVMVVEIVVTVEGV